MLDPQNYFNPATFIEVPFPNHESRPSHICVLGLSVSFLFCDFTVSFRNCYYGKGLLDFHFVIC